VVNLKALGEPVVFVGGVGTFAAYPATGGTPLWTFPVNKMVASSPAVLNGVVYFASTHGTVYAVNAANGALRCSFAMNQFAEDSPVVVEDRDGSGPVIYEGTSPTPGPGFMYAIYGPGNTPSSHVRGRPGDPGEPRTGMVGPGDQASPGLHPGGS
jgi:outer membrane protein assembly factor BamB